MGKYRYWEFDNQDLVSVHTIKASKDAVDKEKLLGFFEFAVERFKDVGTSREQIKVSAKVNGDPSGVVKTDLVNMENDIPKFRSYGVVLERGKYVELCKVISDHYYFFVPNMTGNIDNVVTDIITDEVLEVFCEYIINNDIKAAQVNQESLYNIPVTAFNKVLSDSKYKRFNFSDIKEGLHNRGYTIANKGVFDYVVNIEGTRVKMVSIKEECAQPIIEKLKSVQ